MRCRDAKIQLSAQRDTNLAQPEASKLQAHVGECVSCQSFQRRQDRLHHTLLASPPSRLYPGISTERIMRAVEQQRRISQQLEDLRAQQRSRVAHMRSTGLKLTVAAFLVIGLLTLTIVALAIFRPDLLVNLLNLGGDIIAIPVILVQSLQSSLSLVTFNNWLLSGTALLFVLMLGIWLRLMRFPREFEA